MFCGVIEIFGLCEGLVGGRYRGLFEIDGFVRFGFRKSCKICYFWRDRGGLGFWDGFKGLFSGV